MERKIPQCVGFLSWRDHRNACSATSKANSSIEVFCDGDVRQKASCHNALPQLVCKLRLISEKAIHAAYIERISSGIAFDIFNTRRKHARDSVKNCLCGEFIFLHAAKDDDSGKCLALQPRHSGLDSKGTRRFVGRDHNLCRWLAINECKSAF